jgi:hypothetical protein
LGNRGEGGGRLEEGGGDGRRALRGGKRERGEEGWAAGRDWVAWVEREKGVRGLGFSYFFFFKPFFKNLFEL